MLIVEALHVLGAGIRLFADLINIGLRQDIFLVELDLSL